MSTNPHTITFDLPKVPENAKLLAIAKQSARNLISLFADHEAEIQQAITETEEAKATFNHAIVLDLGKHKQTDKLGFSIKRGDEIVMSIPDPDQGDLFDEMHPRDLPKAKRRDDPVVVDAEEVLCLPAPMELLPAPAEMDVEEVEIPDFFAVMTELCNAPKLQRKKKLNAFLEEHGPEAFRSFGNYCLSLEPDAHMAKAIKEMMAALPPENSCLEDDENLSDAGDDDDIPMTARPMPSDSGEEE